MGTSKQQRPSVYKPTEQFIGLVVCVAACMMISTAGALVTLSSVSDWYANINKPSWNPPNWIFGPVWTTLYLMMAFSSWLVWRSAKLNRVKFELGWFGFHLILNLLWSVLFFGFQQPGLAAIEIVILWISILASVFLYFRHNKLAAILLVPYLLWVTFASTLNITIWYLN